MGDFEFEGPSHSEIWEKIGSSSWSEKLDGLVEAAGAKAMGENDPAGAIPYLDEAVTVADANGDLTALAHVYLLLGMSNWRLGNFEACALAHEAGADAAKRGLLSDLEVDHLAHAGRAYRKLRDFGSMRRNFELALKLAEECGHSWRSSMKAEYGRYLRKIGDLALAQVFLESAYADDVPGPAAKAAGELVRLKLESGDVSGALAFAEEAYAASVYMEDVRGLNSSQFMLAKAMVASGDFPGAKAALDEIKGRQKWGKVKHKVRVDMLYAEALIGLDCVAEALPILARVVPMLRKEKLWVDLGSALELKARALYLSGSIGEYFNVMLEAASAYASGDDVVSASGVYLEIADASIVQGDFASAKSYSLQVVDQVLLSFTEVHNTALGIYALALIKGAWRNEAAAEVERLGAVKDLSGIALAHYYHAGALLEFGVKRRNLAAKAVREYLKLGRHAYADLMVELL